MTYGRIHAINLHNAPPAVVVIARFLELMSAKDVGGTRVSCGRRRENGAREAMFSAGISGAYALYRPRRDDERGQAVMPLTSEADLGRSGAGGRPVAGQSALYWGKQAQVVAGGSIE